MTSRLSVADPADQLGRARWRPRGSIGSSTREATLGSVRIPTPSPLAVRSRRARLGRHSRARPARPPLGAWSGSGRLHPVARLKMAVARAVALRRSGMGAAVPSSRSARSAGQGRGLASSTRGARAPHGRWPHPRRSTSTRPSGVRGSPPDRAGARAPSRSPHGCRSPCGHPACAARHQLECGRP